MSERFRQWCVLELLGHRRLAGLVTEEELFGQAMLRLDVPRPDGSFTTQIYSGASLYCLTPVSEETARGLAQSLQPVPYQRYELPRPERSSDTEVIEPAGDQGDDPDDDDDEEDYDPDEHLAPFDAYPRIGAKFYRRGQYD